MAFKRILNRMFSAKQKSETVEPKNVSDVKFVIKTEVRENIKEAIDRWASEKNRLRADKQNVGDTQTKYDFGYMHSASFETKVKSLLKAHEAGVDDAALYLAYTYYHADPPKYDLAFDWFKKASEADDWEAMAAHKWLAQFYRYGDGCERNFKKAYFYIEMFAAKHDGIQSRWAHAGEPLKMHPYSSRTQAYLNIKEISYRKMSAEEFQNVLNEIQVELDRLGLELAPLEAYIPNFDWFMEKLEKVLINGEDIETINEIINERGYKRWEMWMRINKINSLPKSLIYNEE